MTLGERREKRGGGGGYTTNYLSRAVRAELIFAFIDLTEASGSFLDACRSKESSSSSDLHKQNFSVGI